MMALLQRHLRTAASLAAALYAALPARSQENAANTIPELAGDVLALREISRLQLTKPQAEQLLQVLKTYHEQEDRGEYLTPESRAALVDARTALAEGKPVPDETALAKAVGEVARGRQQLLSGEDGVGSKVAKVLSREQIEALRGARPVTKPPAPRRIAEWIEGTVRKLSEERWTADQDKAIQGIAAAYLAPRDSPDFANAVQQVSDFLERMRKLPADEFNLLRPKLAAEVAQLIGWDKEKNQPGPGHPVDPAVLELAVVEMLANRFISALELRLQKM
jgi:hypothetical protein